MKSIIYIGMDVHKKTYSLCALLKETGEIIGETKIPADVSLIIKFIENAKKSVDSDDVQIKTGYEAGCLGYSLYWQLAAKGIECDILAPSTMHRSAKNKVVKNDRRDAKNIAANLANGTYKSVYVPTDEDVEIKEYSGRKVFIVNPKEQNKSEQTILYIHGGAYMAEVTKDHWDFIKKIVEDTNATVIVPDYPLAPKYTYKEVFNMMEPLYKEIVSKVDMEKFIVMGDSAGGGLALALEEKLSQEKIEMPEKTILISPWLDTRLTNPKIPEVQKRDKQLNKFKLQIAALGYAGKDGNRIYCCVKI